MVDRWSEGWTLVGQSQSSQALVGVWEAERELEERRIIDSWDADDNWPSITKPFSSGPEAKRFDGRFVKHEILGRGGHAYVEAVTYGSVRLARKHIFRRRGTTIEDLRNEGLNMNKLNHAHVVRLVATYALSHELCLLLWPAAVCHLGMLLEDIESLRLGQGDREDIVKRLQSLDLKDLAAIEPSKECQGLDSSAKCPLAFLRNIIGCVSNALAHCHDMDVRHLDIKPSNILLKPDRVYLADFGISRDVSGQDQTLTEDFTGTERWRAPEFYASERVSMQQSDIYSLGLVYMNVAAVLYNVRTAAFDEALYYSPRLSWPENLNAREGRVSKFLDQLTSHSLATPPFLFMYEGQETVRPRPMVQLISRMVATNPRHRPPAAKINDKLAMLGGIHQIYHGVCCKKPVSWIENKWDKKLGALASLHKENEDQRRSIESLERSIQSYELRLQHRDKAYEETIAKLEAKLKKADERCLQLEADGRSLARGGGRPTAPGRTRNGTGSAGSTPKPRSTTTPSASPRATGQQTVPPRPLGDATTGAYMGSRSPSFTNLLIYGLRSGGSASKLPVPVTPNRCESPKFNRDPSSTDSSVASSVFSRRSNETTPTPAQTSPALNLANDKNQKAQWGQLHKTSSPAPSVSSSIVASPQTTVREASRGRGDIPTSRPTVPQLIQERSWAEVANCVTRTAHLQRTGQKSRV